MNQALPSASPPLLSLNGLGKRFGSVWVLRQMDMTLAGGEVHALVGENGAGKSTFIKLLAGVHLPDEGSIVGPDTRALSLRTPGQALAAGIGVVHQELDLFDNLTVAENIALGAWSTGLLRPTGTALRAQARLALQRLNVTLDPDVKLGRLPTSAKQLVAIAKVLGSKARILIFDEPTSALNSSEVSVFLSLVRRLRADGIAIVYVSHKLGEIFQIADRVTVLRDGSRVGTWPVAKLNHDRVVEAMLGRPPDDIFPRARSLAKASVLCRVADLHGPQLRGASLTLLQGEVVALAGLPDAGASSVLRSLFGLDAITGGQLELHGQPYSRPSPVKAIRRGLAYLPADRLRDGLLPLMSVLRNVEAVLEARAAAHSIERHARALQAVRQVMVRAKSLALPITTLSGGNQQKALLARWLVTAPKLLLLDDPTRGVDIGAKIEIYRILRQIASTGTTVAYTSSESLELAQLADRILIFREGQVVEEIHGRVEHELLDRKIAAS